ncbi:unnamed protein product [Adineta steineri]|uniref:PLAT domain-containing protein n=1 Tax=Adineta steineri TaxID=433720 RepID=A0A819GTD3_9BILA|nr:unnamed protein product [Adineta steineri]CAF3891754.1 unnamed protein product [Adineta steineri]
MGKSQSEKSASKKRSDADYAITISTGEEGIEAPVSMKVRGDNGTVSIPLTQTKGGEKSFQSKSKSEFTCQTTDVGKIQCITVEHNEKEKDVLWHIKTVQITKGSETYNFNADVRLDQKENKVNLYPVGTLFGHQRDDYVQSELRRLRESLRSESSKLRRPPHKPHEPFVYNDLRPYFDTSSVERAIYSPVTYPTGYYTRVTALRIVEPWEAYGMDYGVNYELLKHRKTRSLSSKPPPSKPTDESIDRKQGSTHLPPYPAVNMHKPPEYSQALTVDDIPKIRSLIKSRYSGAADAQKEKDYKRTHNDVYRMQLDHIDGYHEKSRGNMLRVYHSYLQNTPGSKQALRELCDQIAPKNTKTTVKSAK